MTMMYLGIDIGGSWIKGTCIREDSFGEFKDSGFGNIIIQRVESPLHADCSMKELNSSLVKLIGMLGSGPQEVAGIGISTAGIVDYAGKRVVKTAEHLAVLRSEEWISTLKEQYNCTVILINDADAAAIGLAELGRLKGNKCIGVMPVGTGIGLSVWRNGRRWRPGKVLSLLGSIQTPAGRYDEIASVSKLACEDPQKDLQRVFKDPAYADLRTGYLENLNKVIRTAAILYDLDEVLLCGGLAYAVTSSDFALEGILNGMLTEIPKEMDHPVKVRVMKEGNLLPLIGALSLARGETEAHRMRVMRTYQALESETPYRADIQLQDLSTGEIIDTLYEAEQLAGNEMKITLPLLVSYVDILSERLLKGGRIIYAGAGTSGRLAAMDAVEIHCTYGFPEERILALISGGLADAAIEIESDFEEDASAVPEMLLLNITSRDIVLGISASGTAYYVQSALAFAKSRGAYTLIIQRDVWAESLSFCDGVIPLGSGNEVVAGSTRMKAGTATKKILNFISSALMIKMGKVAGSYMVDVACINGKLVERAKSILKILYNIDGEEAMEKLVEADMKLSQAIHNIRLIMNKDQ
jgi:N-acetylmuramic acid 6-phosphate etherase